MLECLDIDFAEAPICMSIETLTLTLTALTIGVMHTALGPDHYVPLVALAKAKKWPLGKTLAITAGCGVGHIAGSFLLGLVGVLGLATINVEGFESVRGNVAALLLTLAGALYFLWGLYVGWRSGERDLHQATDHGHSHGKMTLAVAVVFLLGPCEALVPILMYPAATAATFVDRMLAITLVVGAFSLATVLTMLVCVAALYLGLQNRGLGWVQRFRHAWAGFAVFCCGVGVLLGA